MNRLLVTIGVLACGCGPAVSPAPSIAAARDAIVGGTFDGADPQVFELRITGDNQVTSYCTATLIDLRTLLTAAHCLDPRILGASTITLSAMNLSTEAGALETDFIPVTESRIHPGWNLNTLDNDIGLALLEISPATATPKAWNSQSVTAMSGEPLRVVGYGTTGAAGLGSGIRREVGLIFRQVTAAKIFLGDQTAKGICHGDSGGPSFHTFPDGIERVVGVHSYTLDQTCLDGADTRVDVQSSFIQQWISEKEAPSCGEDRRCKIGCTPVDLDCVAIGSGCAGPLQCTARACVSDPQHDAYCSQPCALTTDCPPKMECGTTKICHFKQLALVSLGLACNPDLEACGPGAVCTGRVAGATRCAPMCFDARDCDPDLICETSYDGQRFCTGRPDVILERANASGPAAPTGCSAAPAGLSGWLLIAGWLRRGRSR